MRYNYQWDQQQTPQNNSGNYVPSDTVHTSVVVNADYLFLTDSNLSNIKTNILNRGSSCQKSFCPTLEDICNFVDRATIQKQPTIIFIH